MRMRLCDTQPLPASLRSEELEWCKKKQEHQHKNNHREKQNTFLGGPIRVCTGGHRGNDPLKNVRRVDADWILAEALRGMLDRRISRMSQAFCVDSTSGEGRDWR